MWLDNPVDLVEYCNNNGLADALRNGVVMLYWGVDGKYIPWDGEDKVYHMGYGYQLNELAVIAADDDCLTVIHKNFA